MDFMEVVEYRWRFYSCPKLRESTSISSTSLFGLYALDWTWWLTNCLLPYSIYCCGNDAAKKTYEM